MLEVKPCPFCGGRPHFKRNFEKYRFYHTCKNRKPQINIHSCSYATRKQAIIAWNTRSI